MWHEQGDSLVAPLPSLPAVLGKCWRWQQPAQHTQRDCPNRPLFRELSCPRASHVVVQPGRAQRGKVPAAGQLAREVVEGEGKVGDGGRELEARGHGGGQAVEVQGDGLEAWGQVQVLGDGPFQFVYHQLHLRCSNGEARTSGWGRRAQQGERLHEEQGMGPSSSFIISSTCGAAAVGMAATVGHMLVVGAGWQGWGTAGAGGASMKPRRLVAEQGGASGA